jgi:hypothetical protein
VFLVKEDGCGQRLNTMKAWKVENFIKIKLQKKMIGQQPLRQPID